MFSYDQRSADALLRDPQENRHPKTVENIAYAGA